jgi:hypothetical protein
MCPEDEEEMAYHPDIKDKNGLFCFKDGERACGADCMAFLTERPEGPDYRGQWASCMVLVNEHKSAKHLVILAQGASALIKQGQDKARASQTAPAPVLPQPFSTRNP